MFKNLNKASSIELQAWMLSAGFTGFGLGAVLSESISQFALPIFLGGLAMNLLIMVHMNSKR